MTRIARLLPWAALLLAGIYFLLPLVGTAEFSLSIRRNELTNLLHWLSSLLRSPRQRWA